MHFLNFKFIIITNRSFNLLKNCHQSKGLLNLLIINFILLIVTLINQYITKGLLIVPFPLIFTLDFKEITGLTRAELPLSNSSCI